MCERLHSRWLREAFALELQLVENANPGSRRAFALPASYESLTVDDDLPDDQSGTWEVSALAAVLPYIDYLPEAVANRIWLMTPHYCIDRDVETGGSFWMNHC